MHSRLRTTLATTAAAALTGGLLIAGAGSAAAATAKYADDFNGDGYRDYAYSGSVTDAGSDGSGTVGIIYGTAAGPYGRAQNVTQNSAGVPGSNEWDDGFGTTMAGADFNRDGYADLAVGSPGETVDGRRTQGAVTILWGSAAGLSGGTVVPNKDARQWGAFGDDLASGDFNGDGKPDLAVINNHTAQVYRGMFSKSGFSGTVTKLTRDDLFAEHLVAGRVTKDAAADLVVVGGVDGPSHALTGAWFIRGGSTLTRGATLKLGAGEDSSFAVSGTVADFNKDGYGDIALGQPLADGEKGAVTVWRGGSSGPGSTTKLTQNTTGVTGTSENGDRFGNDLSAGDVNHDGYPDLAVSAVGEDLGTYADAGAVHILRGSSQGLSGTKSQWFERATKGVPGDPEANSSFGSSLRLRDSDRDGCADLFTDYLRFKGSANGITVTGVQSSVRPGFLP
ncbi:FG-GAP repeat protein [Streptomyces sp. NPDC005151]